MSSPVIFPYISYFKIDKTSKTPLYQQILSVFTQLISQGILPAQFQLPSSRNMATLLTVHRKTILKVYDALLDEGLIFTELNKGTYVSASSDSKFKPSAILATKIAISLVPDRSMNNSALNKHNQNYSICLHNGQEGVNLISAKSIGSTISSLLHLPNGKQLMNSNFEYKSTYFSSYIEEQYGINHGEDQILIAENFKTLYFHILSSILQDKDGLLLPMNAPSLINELSQKVTNNIFTYPITDTEIHLQRIEQLFITKPIKIMLVYYGNNYPTNYVMSAYEKKKLLHLAHKYNCLIIEWDQQLNYTHDLETPITAWDTKGNCIFLTEFKNLTFANNPTTLLIGPNDLIKYLKEKEAQLNTPTMQLYSYITHYWLSEGKHKSWIKKLSALQKEKYHIIQSLITLLYSKNYHVTLGAKNIWISFPPEFEILKWQQYLLNNNTCISETLFIENKYLKGFVMNYLDLESLEITYILNLLLEFNN